MTDQKKADQQARPKKMHINDTSSHAQRARLLARIQLGPIDTPTARRELNIMHPAARVKELREQGYPIKAQRIRTTDDLGRPHHGVALYYLSSQSGNCEADIAHLSLPHLNPR